MLINDVLVSDIRSGNADMTIAKGETVYLSIKLFSKNTEQPYILKEGEKLIFGIKKGKSDTNYTIKKQLTNDDEIEGVYPVILSDTDTNIEEGRYYYDVGLKTTDDYFVRPFNNRIVYVTNGITYKGDVE